jgi:outer membrane protein, multidrug efflux system
MNRSRQCHCFGSLLIISSLLLSGCMVGPDYQRPPVDVPDAYLEPAATDPSIANLPWWELFKDPDLTRLIREALANNQDLGIAVSRIEEAAANLGIVRANQFPFLDAQGAAGRLQQSENLVPGSKDRSDYGLTGVASFELDLWGKLRRATQSARAELLATEAAAANVTITLIAAVATTYFELLGVDDRLKIAEQTLRSRNESLRIIQARFDKGTVPELDVNQAEIEAADAAASVAGFSRLVRITENALSILVGSRPRLINRGAISLEAQQLMTDVPAGLPMQLLEQRPDILVAEELLAAETARIGVARARRLPSVSLTGSFGYASSDLDNLLDGDSQAWDIFGNVFAPIFNSGQLKAAEAAQRQRADQARLNYQATVINALRDVDNSLTSIRTYREEHQARFLQLQAATSAASLSWARYNGGVVSYLEVLDSERSLFSAALLESETRQQQLNAVVSLYRALGGGWPASGAD